MQIEHINPPDMHSNPAYSQAVRVRGADTLVFVGGQNGIDSSGAMVGDDLGSQTEQALRNVLTALAAAGAGPQDVTRLGIYIAAGQDVQEGWAAAQRVWGQHPTAITAMFVAGLGVPGALVEIEAVAAVSG